MWVQPADPAITCWCNDHPGPQEFLEANGPLLPDGRRDDPPLAKFDQQIQKYK